MNKNFFFKGVYLLSLVLSNILIIPVFAANTVVNGSISNVSTGDGENSSVTVVEGSRVDGDITARNQEVLIDNKKCITNPETCPNNTSQTDIKTQSANTDMTISNATIPKMNSQSNLVSKQVNSKQSKELTSVKTGPGTMFIIAIIAMVSSLILLALFPKKSL